MGDFCPYRFSGVTVKPCIYVHSGPRQGDMRDNRNERELIIADWVSEGFPCILPYLPSPHHHYHITTITSLCPDWKWQLEIHYIQRGEKQNLQSSQGLDQTKQKRSEATSWFITGSLQQDTDVSFHATGDFGVKGLKIKALKDEGCGQSSWRSF